MSTARDSSALPSSMSSVAWRSSAVAARPPAMRLRSSRRPCASSSGRRAPALGRAIRGPRAVGSTRRVGLREAEKASHGSPLDPR